MFNQPKNIESLIFALYRSHNISFFFWKIEM